MSWRGLRLAVAALAVSGAALVAASPSEAARYHRFKRVDGHWIEGRFPAHARGHVRLARVHSRRHAALAATERRPAPDSDKREPIRHPDTTSSTQPAPAEPPARVAEAPKQDLLSALQRRAAEQAAQLTHAPPAHAPEPVTITLNFRTGMKATSFRNGDISEEPFDPAAVRALASTPPSRTAGR